MRPLEAASPGEWKNRGAGTQLRWGFAESPFGRCSIGWNTRGICHLGFPDPATDDGEPLELTEGWAAAARIRDDRNARCQIKVIFNRHPGASAPLSAFVHGTPFQVKVWRALLRIPSGCVASYGQIARTIG